MNDRAASSEGRARGTVALIGLDRPVLVAVRRALEGLDLEARELGEGEDPAGCDLVVLAPDSPRGAVRGLADPERPRVPAARIALIRHGAEAFLDALDPARPVHLVSAAPRVDGTVLRATIEKLIRGEIFGLDPYFPPGCASREITLGLSEEKSASLEEARDFLAGSGAPGRAASDALLAADELLTNGFYCGPVDSRGRRLHDRLHRAAPVSLEKGLTLALAWDGERIGVSVSDPFGSLDPRTAVRSLGRSVEGGLARIEKKPGGAGLGLYTAFSATSALAFNLAPGARTEVLALIPRSPRSSAARSLGIFLAQ